MNAAVAALLILFLTEPCIIGAKVPHVTTGILYQQFGKGAEAIALGHP